MSNVNFDNNEILNSTMLSDMVYLETRRLHEIKQQQDKLLPFVESLNENFLFKYNIYIESLQDEEDLDRIVNLAYEEIFPNIKSSEEYQELIKKRHYFNWERGDRKIDYAYNEKISVETEDIEKEIKKQILPFIFNEFKMWKNKNMVDVYDNFLAKQQTSIDFEYAKNLNLEQTKKDTDDLWEKFEKVIPNEEIIKKYSKPYETKTSLNIVAEFNNGYIDVGRENGFKDASFMVGYLTSETGEKVLQVVFRGTEDKAMPTTDYFIQHYPNMERQYQRIEPILEEIIAQELEKHKKAFPNQKLNVMFSGHSLGAALAEKALDKHKDNGDIAYKGVLIANPGSFHYMQKAINGLDFLEKKLDKIKIKDSKFKILGKDAIKASLSLGKDVLTAGVVFAKIGLFLGVVAANYSRSSIKMGFTPLNENHNFVDQIIKYSTFNCAKMLTMGFGAIIGGFGAVFEQLTAPFIEYKDADKRSITINHINDNIPQAGRILFQNENDNNVSLVNNVPKLTQNPIAYQLAFHKTYNYYTELKERAKSGKLFTPVESSINDTYVKTKLSIIEKMKKLKEDFSPKNIFSEIKIHV